MKWTCIDLVREIVTIFSRLDEDCISAASCTLDQDNEEVDSLGENVSKKKFNVFLVSKHIGCYFELVLYKSI